MLFLYHCLPFYLYKRRAHLQLYYDNDLLYDVTL